MQVGLSCPDCRLVYSDWAQDEIKRLREECRLAAELQVRTGQVADAESERLRAALEKHHLPPHASKYPDCGVCGEMLAIPKRA